MTHNETSQRALQAAAGSCALLAVALGAFGAHALESHLNAEALDTWDTATRYLMWHALAALLMTRIVPGTRLPGGIILAGAMGFAVSLYLWVLTDWLPLVALTPIGGVIMLTGWAVFIWKVLKQQ